MKKGSPIMLRLPHTPHNGRAKDGSLSTADGLAALGGVVGRRIAWTQSLAAVVDSHGDRVCPRAADGHQLVAGRRSSRRLRRLLLLPPAPGPQVQRSRPTAVHGAVDTAGQQRPRAAGRGRLAHQAVWPAGPGSRNPSQPYTWSG